MEQDVTDKFANHEGRIGALESGRTEDKATMTELKKDVSDLKASQQIQLEILQRLDAVASNPSVKIILAVLAMAAASWAANKGLK